MKSGIYHVSFKAGNQNFGDGIVTIKDGVVNGGDDGYVYTGPLIVSGPQLSGQLHVERWNASHQSIFGPLQRFDLTLAGSANDAAGTFSVSGNVTGQANMKIDISGRFLAAAA